MPKHEKRNILILKGDGLPFISKKLGRNELCTCGSGKKNKNCCKIETQYFKSPVNNREYTK